MQTRREFLHLLGFSAAAVGTGCAATGNRREGWSDATIEYLKSHAARQGGLGWAAWRGHNQLASWRDDYRGPALSITKTIAALAAARAAGEGWLSPHEKVSDTIPEWRTDALKSRITVRMLLQQTSGLEGGARPLYHNHPRDKGRAAISLRVIDSPGTTFRYGPAHWEVLGEVLKRKLAARGQTLEKFLHRAVLRPVGLNSPKWRSDGLQTPYLSTGAEFTVKQLGKLGRTLISLLNGSSGDGISASHFAAMTQPSSVNPIFGGGLWRNVNAGKSNAAAIEIESSIDDPISSSIWHRACLSTRQPEDFVTLIGSGGRRIYLWPSQNQIIARLGSSDHWSDVAFLGGL
ncbi:MAG: serine hydrolase domain-containing protein [Luteolibacter sp.]